MASLWKIEDVDVYVTGHDPAGDVKLAELVTLDSVGTSTVHFFGSGAEKRSVNGWIFSETNVDTIRGYRDNGTTVSLTSNRGDEGDYIIQECNFKEFGPFVRLSLTGYDPTSTSIYQFQAKFIKVG
jgi:hypothetical protein